MKRIEEKTVAILAALLIAILMFGCGVNTENTWDKQYDLGIRYLSEGSYEKAVIAFLAAIGIDPKNDSAYLSLADAYMAMEDEAQALQILHQGYEETASEQIAARIDEINALSVQNDGAPDEEGDTTEEDLQADPLYYGEYGKYFDDILRWEELTVAGGIHIADITYEQAYDAYGGGNVTQSWYEGFGKVIDTVYGSAGEQYALVPSISIGQRYVVSTDGNVGSDSYRYFAYEINAIHEMAQEELMAKCSCNNFPSVMEFRGLHPRMDYEEFLGIIGLNQKGIDYISSYFDPEKDALEQILQFEVSEQDGKTFIGASQKNFIISRSIVEAFPYCNIIEIYYDQGLICLACDRESGSNVQMIVVCY